MSHSVVKDTPAATDNTLVIVVGQDGSISVDQETLDSLMSLGSQTTEVSVVRVNENEGSTVDMTLDTYQHTDIMDDLSINVDEVQRNYNSFRMDHCYTPLTSPSQKHPIPSDPPDDPDSELDDLAQTLSILEGSYKPVQTAKISSPVKTPKVIEKQKPNLIQNDKVTLLNKVNKLSVNKVYKGVKTVLNKPQKVIKKVQNESDNTDDDFNDSDFELNDTPKTKIKRTYKRNNRPRLEISDGENVKQKIVKVRKGMKNIIYKPKPVVEPAKPIVEPVPVPPPEPIKSPEAKKPQPKKEKKIPKPLDDGIALFSTPDIIRRVGKPGEKLEKTPEAVPVEPPKHPKPAKIEDRSHSDTTRTSLDSKPKLPQRLSLDSKVIDKPIDKKLDSAIEPLMYPQANIVPNLIQNTPLEQNTVFTNLPDVKAIEAPVPSVEEMSALINNTPINSETPPIHLEAPLDIDHNILDNINTDELIPEDILYQVAKLVENPDVQNAIDKTLVDGSLVLDPALQQQIQVPTPTPIVEQLPPQPMIQQSILSAPTTPVPQVKTPQRQIVRSDGRVVVLPPIEKPATRSSKKKQEAETVPPIHKLQQPIQNVVQQPAVPQIPTIRQQQKMDEVDPDLVASEVESDSDESWNSEDDPDRLWCICKQPHNNRFMICCDTCEDWFHGKCVNITKAMGQQMEQQGKEWMCPNCIKKQNLDTSMMAESIPESPKAVGQPEKIDSSNHRKSTESSAPACIVCGAPSRASSVYCSDQCILKHAQGVERDTKQTAVKNQPQKIIVFERATGKCISGPNAPTAANLKQWLKEHPGFEVVRPVNKTMAQSKLQLVKSPSGKGVSLAVNKKGMQVGILPHSAKPQVSQIRLIPATKLNIPGAKTKTANATTPNKPKPPQTIKSPPHNTTPAKTTKAPPPSPKVEKTAPKQPPKKPETPVQTPVDKSKALENIRENVKKTLFEQLTTRLKEAEDLKLTEEEVTKLANDIESQLYKLFGDAGPKYRTKYRSLIFNIKDTKNHTLWRRICEKTIAPSQLVRLSPDDLASQELARWRERETKHQLDMIKKSELEMLSLNRTYVLKTHKGEHVMEDKPNKVDSADLIAGLGADSTSEEVAPSDKNDNSDHSDRRNSKHSKKDRERRSSKDRDKDRRSNKDHKRRRSRSRDRDRSSHKSDRKRSRSRDRHRHSSHKSSRHKRDRHSIDYLDKKSKEILDNLENNKIVLPPEDRLWKHVPQQDIQVTTPDSDSDHEPTSTVTIPTPPRSTEQDDHSNTITNSITTEPPRSDTPELKSDKIEVKTPRVDPRLNKGPEVKSLSPVPPKTPEETKELPLSIGTKITSLSAETIVWEGNINMIDVAKFFITLHEVSGDCNGIGTELPATLEIVGRISPDTVWEYIGKMRRSNSKMISVLRLTAANMEEKMPYIALYSYLSSRNRLGVIKSSNSAVKDFYILPLASHAPVPQSLLPLSGPGFEESRPHLLLGIIVRAKRKRPSMADIIAAPNTKRTRLDSPSVLVPAVVAPQPPRSYTPPPNRDPRLKLPPVTPVIQNTTTNDEDEPYSPEDSDPETTPVIPNRKPVKPIVPDLTSLLTTVTGAGTTTPDLTSIVTGTFKNTFLETAAPQTMTSFEPFNNKFDGIPGLDVDTGVDSLQRKMEELDKCIEKQKEEIRSISQDIVQSGAAASMATNLSNISLPSNLQQILDSIKNIPATTNLDSQNPQNMDEYTPTAPGYKATAASEELTIPLLLPKLSSRSQISSAKPHMPAESTIPLQLPVPPREVDPLPLPNLNIPPQLVQNIPNLNIQPNVMSSVTSTIPLNLPKLVPKAAPSALTSPGIAPANISDKPAENKSVLSSLSEEELIRKANEMLGETEPQREETPEPEVPAQKPSYKSAPVLYNSAPAPKRPKIDLSQPPIPGLEEDDY